MGSAPGGKEMEGGNERKESKKAASRARWEHQTSTEEGSSSLIGKGGERLVCMQLGCQI